MAQHPLRLPHVKPNMAKKVLAMEGRKTRLGRGLSERMAPYRRGLAPKIN